MPRMHLTADWASSRVFPLSSSILLHKHVTLQIMSHSVTAEDQLIQGPLWKRTVHSTPHQLYINSFYYIYSNCLIYLFKKIILVILLVNYFSYIYLRFFMVFACYIYMIYQIHFVSSFHCNMFSSFYVLFMCYFCQHMQRQMFIHTQCSIKYLILIITPIIILYSRRNL